MVAQSLNEQLAIGTAVFDATGDKLGTLVGSDAYVLLVAHGFFFPTKVSVPLAAVARVDADGIWLSRTGDEVRQEAGNGGASAAAPVELAGAPS
jgi:hypothetical protein